MTEWTKKIVVSVIMPVYNCQEYIEECLESILSQELQISETEKLSIEICIYEDGSNDKTAEIIEGYKNKLQKSNSKNFWLKICRNESGIPRGVGYGRNKVIKESSGDFLCFCDADDVMLPKRILVQYKLTVDNLQAIVGSKYRRYPEDSTQNFTKWANLLTPAQLYTQIFLSFGPTLVMPTWFCYRGVYEKIDGGFDETIKGVPEDLLFFYKHLRAGGKLIRAEEVMMIYRYHPGATTFSVSEKTIWNSRISEIQYLVLSKWTQFTIWNAGKLGRRFFRSLNEDNQKKVVNFCDVDSKKILQSIYKPYPLTYEIPIIHVQDARPPFIICVKTELTWDDDGSFRKLLDSLNIQEGIDYYFFN